MNEKRKEILIWLLLGGVIGAIAFLFSGLIIRYFVYPITSIESGYYSGVSHVPAIAYILIELMCTPIGIVYGVIGGFVGGIIGSRMRGSKAGIVGAILGGIIFPQVFRLYLIFAN